MNPSASAGHLPPVDGSLREQIRAEQLRMLLGRPAFATVLASGFAVMLAMYAAPRTTAALAYGWLALKVLTALARTAQERLFALHPARPGQRWYPWAVALITTDGLCWGLAGLLLLHAPDEQTATVVSAGLLGAAAVATFTLHANWLANAAFCVPMLVPVSALLLMRGDAFGWYGGGTLLLFLAALLVVARQAQRHVLELLWGRLLIDRVVAEKDAALREAERQNMIKSQFVATMSHELRTPLHGILGLTRLLLRSVPDAGHRQQLGLVQRSGEHLLTLINHILDYSRIDAGHLNIEDQSFDLTALLDDVLNLTAVSAETKGLMLYRHVQLPHPCWVRGDAAKVRQVLLNLIGNAVKFTERGRVEVRVHRRAEDGHVVVQVVDSGIGISEQDLTHIFDPYRQADSAMEHAVGGTGLGLTISRQISRAMGGDITCTSQVGRGSTFEFSAPLPDSDATGEGIALPRPWVSSPTCDLTPALLLKGHVLLAEDNEVNAMIAETQLTRLGLTVELVSDGLQALDRLMDTHAPRPDLVLMDCQMPRMDGFEATRRWRQHEGDRGLPHLPVIALTASAMAQDTERCLQAGMDAHLAKPFEDAQLTRLLTRYLTAQAHAAPA